MKKTLLIIGVLLLSVLSVSAAKGGVESAGVALNLSILKYEPVPAHPGDSIDVWVKLDNKGGDIARNTKLEFVDAFPFRLESEQRRLHTLGALAGGFDYVAKYKVRVAQDAPVGTAYAKARYTYGNSEEERWVEQLLEIDLDSRITALSIESVETTPKQLMPGGEAQVKIKVKNIAESVIRRVSAKLDFLDSTVPIVPTSRGSEIKIEELNPGEEAELVFDVVAQLNAEANAYKVPLNLSFTEDTGTLISHEEVIGVVIASTPEIEFTVDNVNLFTDEPTGTVTLQFVNKGVDEIKFVYIRLQPSDTYELLSPTTEYYVGNIDSDDYEVEDISIKALAKNVEIPMEVEFRDSANKLYTMTETINVNLVEKQEAEGTGFNFMALLPWLILILVLGYFWWKKRRRKEE